MLTNALNDLTTILKDEAAVSAYELHSSGLIQTLLNLFATAAPPNVSENIKLSRKLVKFQKQRVEIFRECFTRIEDMKSADEEIISTSSSPANEMVRKLVSVLESIEKLPVHLYDNSQSGYGLQVCGFFSEFIKIHQMSTNGTRILTLDPIGIVVSHRRRMLQKKNVKKPLKQSNNKWVEQQLTS